MYLGMMMDKLIMNLFTVSDVNLKKKIGIQIFVSEKALFDLRNHVKLHQRG